MDLYLLRHGIAADLGTAGITRDSDRPLTPEGERKTRSTAKCLLALGVSFDRTYSSPVLRARQTAVIVARTMKLTRALEFTEALCPGADSRDLFRLLKPIQPGATILLVGHEPGLSELAALVISGEPGPLITLKKGGLCKLAVRSELRPTRCASLEWLLTPKHMAFIK